MRANRYLFVLVCVAAVVGASPSLYLPDGSVRPGVTITIRAGDEKEFLFRPEGVRFLSGRARLYSVGRPFVGPEGEQIKEFVIDVGKSPMVPWMHDDKPFRLRIRAETDFTLQARQSWEWNEDEDSAKPNSF